MDDVVLPVLVCEAEPVAIRTALVACVRTGVTAVIATPTAQVVGFVYHNGTEARWYRRAGWSFGVHDARSRP